MKTKINFELNNVNVNGAQVERAMVNIEAEYSAEEIIALLRVYPEVVNAVLEIIKNQ